MTTPKNPSLTSSQKNELLAVITSEAGGRVLPSNSEFGFSFQPPNDERVHVFSGREDVIKYAENLGVDLLELDAQKTALGGLGAIQNTSAAYAAIIHSIKNAERTDAGFVELPTSIARNMKNAGLSTSITTSQQEVWEELLQLPKIKSTLEKEFHQLDTNNSIGELTAREILKLFKTIGIEFYSTISNKKLERSKLLVADGNREQDDNVNKDKLTGAFQKILDRALDNNKGKDYFIHQVHAFTYQHNVSLMTDSSAKHRTPPAYMSPDVIGRLNHVYFTQSKNRTGNAFENIDITGKLSPIGVSFNSETFDESIRLHLRNQVGFIRNSFLSKLSHSEISRDDVEIYKTWLKKSSEVLKESFNHPSTDLTNSIYSLSLMTRFLSPKLFSQSENKEEMERITIYSEDSLKQTLKEKELEEQYNYNSDIVSRMKETFYEVINEFSSQCPDICNELIENWEKVYPSNKSVIGLSVRLQEQTLKSTIGNVLNLAKGDTLKELKGELRGLSSLDIDTLNPPWPSVFEHLNNEVNKPKEKQTSFRDALKESLTYRSYLEVVNEFKKTVLPSISPKEEQPEIGFTETKPPKQEPPKQQAPKQEAPKQQAPKQEAPKQQAPKQEAPKQQAPKQEAPKQEAPKQEAPKQEVPKPQASELKQNTLKETQAHLRLRGDSFEEKISYFEDDLMELFFNKNDEISLPDAMDWFTTRYKEVSERYENEPEETKLMAIFASFRELSFCNNRKALKEWYESSAENKITAEKITKQKDELTLSKNPLRLANAITDKIFDEAGFIPEWIPGTKLKEALSSISSFNLFLTMSSDKEKVAQISKCDDFLDSLETLKEKWGEIYRNAGEKQPILSNLWHRSLSNCDLSDGKSISSTLKFLESVAEDKETLEGVLNTNFDSDPNFEKFQNLERDNVLHYLRETLFSVETSSVEAEQKMSKVLSETPKPKI